MLSLSRTPTMQPEPTVRTRQSLRQTRRTCGTTKRSFPSDRKSTRLNSSHGYISYAVFCLKKKISRREGRFPSAPPVAIHRPTKFRRSIRLPLPSGLAPPVLIIGSHTYAFLQLRRRRLLQ